MELKDTTILVVDDNPTNLNVLSDCLTNFGFTVLLKKDGEKAISLLERKHPDIILLDIVMPGMNGFEVCKRLKENSETKDIPVIFMTALSDTADKIRGFELGAVDYITKPLQHEEVLARVRAHLTIQNLKTDLQIKNKELKESLERERKLMEDLRLNLSISLPHELRTPLNAVLGFSEFLTHRKILSEPDKITEYGKLIYESGLRLHRLVENALLYANLKLLKYAPSGSKSWQRNTFVDAKRSITSVARKEAKAVQREADLVLELADTHIQISEKNFEKILSEIISNAFKFSKAGTPVRVKIALNGNLCLLSIADEGCGMQKEQIDDIGAYMQFNRRQHEQQGAGLGLVIALLLSRLEGGMLSIDSIPGKGTTVSIVLNCKTSLPAVSEKDNWFDTEHMEFSGNPKITGYRAAYSSFGKSNEKIRILVVHEKKENRSPLVNLLGPLGFDIAESFDIRDAMDKTLENQAALIFTDMPTLEEESFETVRQIRNMSKSEQILIAISDTASNHQEKLALLCDDFICKPVQVQDIFDKLEAYLGVEWIYEGETENPVFDVPPEPELSKLMDMTVRGYLTGILETLDEIEQSDPRYAPFAAKLRQYADVFQLKLIQDFIHKYL
jgi:DNA-binding response OmpR family regulator